MVIPKILSQKQHTLAVGHTTHSSNRLVHNIESNEKTTEFIAGRPELLTSKL